MRKLRSPHVITSRGGALLFDPKLPERKQRAAPIVERCTALARDIPVIPILLDGARVPREIELPEELQELSLRNGLNVHGASFYSDIDTLIRDLEDQFFSNPPPRDAPSGLVKIG